MILEKEKISFACLFLLFLAMCFALVKGYEIHDGGIVENIQAAVLVLIFIKSIITLKNPKNKFKLFYTLVILASLWGFLEEINYGQRIFGYSIPDFFRTYNIQKEFNIHNFSKYTGEFICLAIVTIFGGILIFKKRITNSFFNRFIPEIIFNNSKYIIAGPLLFAIITIITSLLKTNLPFNSADLGEVFELYFYLSVLVFIF